MNIIPLTPRGLRDLATGRPLEAFALLGCMKQLSAAGSGTDARPGVLSFRTGTPRIQNTQNFLGRLDALKNGGCLPSRPWEGYGCFAFAQ